MNNVISFRNATIGPGGLLDVEGKMKGSVLIMEYENREQLDENLANEPYVQEKV